MVGIYNLKRHDMTDKWKKRHDMTNQLMKVSIYVQLSKSTYQQLTVIEIATLLIESMLLAAPELSFYFYLIANDREPFAT